MRVAPDATRLKGWSRMVTAWSPNGTPTGRVMTADRLDTRRSGWDGAVELIDAQVRDVVRREGIDPLRDPAAVTAIVTTVVREYDERSLAGVVPPIADLEAVSREVHDRVAGFGPLQRYLDDPSVERVCQVVPSRHDQVRRSVLPVESSP